MKAADGRNHGPGGNGGGPADSYLLCATPRTGSTLLCGLLESTGVAGHPESYFRRQDKRSWANRWNITGAEDGAFDFADYVGAARSAGRTEDGVFATRVMWGTLDEILDDLGTVHPARAGSGAGLLDQAFGMTRFVHLRRGDVVAQAVSWLRAEQTGQWQEIDRARLAGPAPEPRFDADRIDDLIRTIDAHNRAWQEWFADAGIRPYPVRYEDIVDDPVGVTGNVLDFLGLELPPGVEIGVRHRRLGDILNVRWIDRYRTLRGR